MGELEQKTVIVTDSISSLTQAMGRAHGIHVVPIYIFFGTEAYCDDIDLDADAFYRRLRNNSQLPTTSQPTAVDFRRVYENVAPRADAIVSIHASEKVSATVDSARTAGREFTGVPVHVIDSETLSMGQGLIVTAAALAAAAGKSTEEIIQLVEGLIPKTHVLFTVETLEYLRRGGRIGGATALLGSALQIKPVLHIKDGQVEPLEKPRTRKKATARLLDLMAARVGTSKAVHAAVLHCDAPDDAQQLAERIEGRFNCVELITTEAGPTIGAHGGPGTLGMAFYAL